MPYFELHARSAFSFLRGASNPEDLARRTVELELPGVALLDRDGVYGAPRIFNAARENGFRALVGAELTMEDGSVVPLLAESRTGYQNLCRLITETKLTPRALTPPRDELDPGIDPRERKRPCFATWKELADHAEGLVALSGDEEGPVRRAWRKAGAAAAVEGLERLLGIFGRDRLFVELQRHRVRGEEKEIQFLANVADLKRLPLLATGGVTYATKAVRQAADVFTCLRLHTTLDAAGRRLSANDERYLKSARQMSALFQDFPEAILHTERLAQRLEFSLKDLGYRFPEFPVPPGHTMETFLRERTFIEARERLHRITPALRAQLEKELAVIVKLGFVGYFLIVWDICRWAREHGILVQGRGSAANSAVCFCLGITAVNPLEQHLLFERFLSEGRVGVDGKPSWPDIDLDFPSGDLRERVIQEIYRRYAPRGASMTANVITYRGRSTVREIGKVLGFADSALDRFSSLYANGDFPETLQLKQQLEMAGIPSTHPRAEALATLYQQIRGLPRHLGQHSGGMVICQGSLSSVVPLEQASMPGRVVCQWDKDDCEDLGIIKVDFLGLGMMAVLQDTLALCEKSGRGPAKLHEIPMDDEETFAAMRRAETVGVFQIESRAQMATLPRLKPKVFYDVAMQVAIVRPGPIVGHLVHPLIRRRNGEEAPEFIDPSVQEIVRPILERTMGVVLFQEQMLELGMCLANLSGREVEELRRAMGFTRNTDRLQRALERFVAALRRQGRNETVVKKLTDAALSFAAYGFPESHAISFALLAYASTWLKVHRPAEFLVGLLNNQPMGFYSPATLLQDFRRRCGVKAKPACVCQSDWPCTVVDDRSIRIGLSYVRGVRETSVRTMLAARGERPFTSLADFLKRTDFSAPERRALASVGALNALAEHRRAALWQVEAAWSNDESLFQRFAEDETTLIPLAPMTMTERFAADFSGMSITTGVHPMAMLRDRLPDVYPAGELPLVRNGERVSIAGSVICRQRPGTAKGFVFVSLEDETGIANAVVTPDFFEQHRLVITQEPSMKITGKLQNVSGVIHVRAEKIEPLRQTDLPDQTSHDFH
ncbi:error-prone DNA polymerase [Opitutaceae bacterium EW11]|nr:error-prone DNA polymerase [Opitutaceae bacterium EW11]